MSPERITKNEAVLSRMAARREVRRLRQNKKKVPAELLAQAGFGAAAEPVARKRKVTVTVEAKAGPVTVTVSRQQAAKELGIKNRRWMTVAELDEAINLVDHTPGSVKCKRLDELEELGRGRCRAAWDAWKAKQTKQT